MLIPRRIDQGVLCDLVEFALQNTIVFDSPLAFFRLLLADGLGGPLAGDKTGPAIVGAMEFCRTGFASAVGLAALTLGGGEGAGKKGALGANGDGGSWGSFWA